MNENNNSMYKVPEGYFDSLQRRLNAIPQEQAQEERITFWTKAKPYVALAACFAVAVVAGNLILSTTTRQADDMMDTDILLSANIPVTDPYMVYEQASYDEQDSYSEEDLAEYILESGITVDQLAYLLK